MGQGTRTLVSVKIRKMNAELLISFHRHDILIVAQRNGASNLRLFGSVVRGEADDESDVDLLVDLDPGRSLFDLVRLQAELERVLGRRVDVVTERGLRERIRTRILAEARPL